MRYVVVVVTEALRFCGAVTARLEGEHGKASGPVWVLKVPVLLSTGGKGIEPAQLPVPLAGRWKEPWPLRMSDPPFPSLLYPGRLPSVIVAHGGCCAVGPTRLPCRSPIPGSVPCLLFPSKFCVLALSRVAFVLTEG